MLILLVVFCLINWIWFSSRDIESFWLLFLIIIGVLLVFNLPSFVLFLNYYEENKYTDFEIVEKPNSIKINQNGIIQTYMLNDCKKSTYHLAYNYKNTIDNRGRDSMFFSDFGYWDLQFENGDRYYLTNLLNDFVHQAPIIRKTKYRFRLFPYIKKFDSKEGVKLKSIPKKY
jgi:hypothetical protein